MVQSTTTGPRRQETERTDANNAQSFMAEDWIPLKSADVSSRPAGALRRAYSYSPR